MAGRGAPGGRGGGDGGGRGRGRGGGSSKPSIFTPQLLGGLSFTDIIAQSKEGTDVLYPPMDVPETDFPSERETRIARRYNGMASESKFTPYLIDAPTKASSDIERYSDRYKLARSSADGIPTPLLASLHSLRRYDRSLLPNVVFEAVFEKKDLKKRGRAGEGRVRSRARAGEALLAGGEEGAEVPPKAGDESDELEEEDPDGLEDEYEDEDENDYGDNYFDNGEDDGGEGGDALGGGGDEDGGTFD